MDQISEREELINLMENPTMSQTTTSNLHVSAIKDKDLRILIFTATYFVLDGVTLTIRRIEGHLRSRGAKVKICTTVGPDVTEEQLKDVIVVPGIKIPYQQAGTYAFGIDLKESTIKQIEEYNPTCIHFTVPDLVSLEGIRYCQRNNIPYIGTWHSNYVDYFKYYFVEWALGWFFIRYFKAYFEQIPNVYVPTQYLIRRLEQEGYGKYCQMKEWSRGIDLKLFSPQRRSEHFRASKGFTDDDVVLLWVGRLVPEKRVDIWMNVIKKLQQEGHSVQAMVVGSGTYEKALAQIHRVQCCGWLSGVALAEAYASSDVFLFPSDVETFGNVTLEALASGVPCVVERKCGGHLVEHGTNGYVCTASQFEDFYQATKRLVLDAEMRKRMSAHARQSSWKYERSIILQQMADNYKRAMDNHSDPNYIRNFMNKSPVAAGNNALAVVCCDYWLLKNIAGPFLMASAIFQNIIIGTNECMSTTRNKWNNSTCCGSHSRLNLLDSSESTLEEGFELDKTSRYEDEKKGRNQRIVAASVIILSKLVHYFTISFSVGLVLVFVYAAFTV